jgi:hypothetical protein
MVSYLQSSPEYTSRGLRQSIEYSVIVYSSLISCKKSPLKYGVYVPCCAVMRLDRQFLQFPASADTMICASLAPVETDTVT